jgi:molecular chaperone HtpG
MADANTTQAKTKKTAKKETHGFQTEAKQLLHLMIHSLYSNREIFLRELVSNASDAVDKLRFQALSDASLLKDGSDLKIVIEFDEKAKTLTVRDNGIGMSRDEVVENLGTIAKSGTKAFMEGLTGDQSKDSQMIGQFGVGFYSAFMVADKVVVTTRRAGDDAKNGTRWESGGEGEYTLEAVEKPLRGTEVLLHFKADAAKDILNQWDLRSIITRYSDHIALPIEMAKMPEMDESGKPKPQTGEVEFEVVNRATALWTRAKSDIKDEEYKEFYKHVSQDFNEPLTWTHNKMEGNMQFTSLLYIPQQAPFDMWDRERKSGLKLYVQRVFIMDNAEVLPTYLRFVKGVIDSNDLPLNVSREILQSNAVLDKIKSSSVKKILDKLAKMAKNKPEDYATFYEQFGQVLKEGPAEDQANQQKIAALLRFASTHTDDAKATVSFEDYISRMKDGQDTIYYVTAESYAAAKNSPHLEMFNKKGIEVILMFDRVDEWVMSSLHEFDGKKVQSVAQAKLDDLGTEDEQKEEKAKQETFEKDFKSVLKQMTTVLGEKVKEVRVSSRLTDSPACIVPDENGMSMHLQKLMASAGQAMPAQKVIMELNPEHRLVEALKDEQDDDRFADWTHLLFDQALLAEGGQLDDPASFVRLVNKFL